MINATTGTFHVSTIRRFNTWYTIRDGSWDDSSVWISNGTKRHTSPQPGDTVYINHVITISLTNASRSIGDLYVRGTLKGGGNFNSSLNVNNFNCSGTLDFSGDVGNRLVINVDGYYNSFSSIVPSTGKFIILFNSLFSHEIPTNVTYDGVGASAPTARYPGIGGVKYITSTLNAASFEIFNGAIVELGNQDINVGSLIVDTSNIITGIYWAPTLSKTGAGTINITTPVLSRIGGIIKFTGNPTINFSGTALAGDMRFGCNLGTGNTFNFLENCLLQIVDAGNRPGSMGACNFVIASGKTLTGTSASAWLNKGTLTGADATSTYHITAFNGGNDQPSGMAGNGGYVYGSNNTLMPVGTLSIDANVSIGYAVNMTSQFNAYKNLYIYNGAKLTLVGNTTVSSTAFIGGGVSQLELGTYDFTSSTLLVLNGKLSKSGSGTVNINNFLLDNTADDTVSLDFTAGNPTVNLSGYMSGRIDGLFNFGTGIVNVLQNTSFSLFGAAYGQPTIIGNFLIASGKTLTNTLIVSYPAQPGGFVLGSNGSINGADSTAIFDNRSVCLWNSSTVPMSTGKLYTNQANNLFVYGLAGNQDIQTPSDATPGYRDLTLRTSGAKRLLSNVSVKGIYTLVAPATLDTNGFALTNP